MSVVETFQLPQPFPNCDCLLCKRTGLPTPITEAPMLFTAYKIVKADGDSMTELSENEVKQFEDQHSRLAEWTTSVRNTDWWKTCSRMIKHLLRDKDAGPFKEPVDTVKLNIPDYYKFIRHPMDLGTINKKLHDDPIAYGTPDQFVNDVRLVFRNCYIYNPKTSPIWAMADALSRKFEEQVISYLAVQPSLLRDA